MCDLSGQVALVTGASRGVGKGAALGWLEYGFTGIDAQQPRPVTLEEA